MMQRSARSADKDMAALRAVVAMTEMGKTTSPESTPHRVDEGKR